MWETKTWIFCLATMTTFIVVGFSEVFLFLLVAYVEFLLGAFGVIFFLLRLARKIEEGNALL